MTIITGIRLTKVLNTGRKHTVGVISTYLMNLTSRVGMALLRHSGNYAWRRIRLERESVHKQNTAQEEPVWGDRHSQGMLSADELCWFCTLPLLREASHFVKQHTWFNTVMYSASFCTPTTLTLASIKQKIFQFRENCVCKCNFWIKFAVVWQMLYLRAVIIIL